MSKELLKQAADQIETLVARVGELEAANAALTQDNVKLASAHESVKVAADKAKTELAGQAKLAADHLFNAGVFRTADEAAAFADTVLDHSKALNALGNLAGRIGSTKIAEVVDREVTGDQPLTADQVWDARASAFLATKR